MIGIGDLADFLHQPAHLSSLHTRCSVITLTSSSMLLLGKGVLKNIFQPLILVRCFIAAEVSDDAKGIIARIMRKVGDGRLKVVGKELLHITIKFLGEIGEDDVEKCKAVIDSCTDRKIPVTLFGGGAFASPYKARVIFVNVISTELVRTAECIRSGTTGFGDDGRPFVSHLTVARSRGKPINASGIIEMLKQVQLDETIEKITLKKSTLTPTGPVYDDIYVKCLK